MQAIKMTASTMESGLGFLLDFREVSPKGDLINLNVEAFIRFT